MTFGSPWLRRLSAVMCWSRIGPMTTQNQVVVVVDGGRGVVPTPVVSDGDVASPGHSFFGDIARANGPSASVLFLAGWVFNSFSFRVVGEQFVSVRRFGRVQNQSSLGGCCAGCRRHASVDAEQK